jgi:3-hydroxyisobutyrate dehydrogenase
MAKIGFIGLGNMGGPMAANLVKAGHAVIGFDVVPAAVRTFTAAGGAAANDLREAIAGCETIVTMLPAGRHVRQIYLGDDGVLAHAAPGTLLIDSSTIDVATAREVADLATQKGLPMIDAPVSGGVGGAQGGTLTFMVGGSDDAFARARPFLETMGKTIVHAGGAGNGQAAKICNNMILGISMIAVSEAFALGERLGLDAQKLFDISSKSSGQCWSMTSYCPVPGPVPTSPANRDYKAGFTAAMMLKDLRLAQDASISAGATTPLGKQAVNIYEQFVDSALSANGGIDFSGVYRYLRS